MQVQQLTKYGQTDGAMKTDWDVSVIRGKRTVFRVDTEELIDDVLVFLPQQRARLAQAAAGFGSATPLPAPTLDRVDPCQLGLVEAPPGSGLRRNVRSLSSASTSAIAFPCSRFADVALARMTIGCVG
jgi:hypothetical protein